MDRSHISIVPLTFTYVTCLVLATEVAKKNNILLTKLNT